MKPIAAPLFFVSLLCAGMAKAEVECAVPMTQWQPRDAVMQLAITNEWAVRRIKIDDGCYELYGTDAQGREIEVKIQPGTLAILEIEYEYDDHDDHED